MLKYTLSLNLLAHTDLIAVHDLFQFSLLHPIDDNSV